MLSEDSSNRLDSGNAFDGDSPGPLSPVGGQSLEISWTESSQNNSASQGREVAEDGKHNNKEASSSENEQWSCADLISTISFREANRIVSKYDIEVAFLQQRGRAHKPLLDT